MSKALRLFAEPVLFDMDGVLADFDSAVATIFASNRRLAPFARNIFTRTEYYIQGDTPSHQREIDNIINSDELWSTIPMYAGIAEKLNRFASITKDRFSRETFIRTGPHISAPTCLLRKHELVQRVLGPEWVKKLIITTDKSLVRGCLLIEDRPDPLQGLKDPSWMQVVYPQTYNESVPASVPRFQGWGEEDILRMYGHPAIAARLSGP